MIRMLVVDDDFRVARIHAASVERVAGFTCVGEAHTAAEARQAIAELHPDLMLLDIYLPDEDGLSLLRSLHAWSDSAPDCIVITAARDLQTVRSAMQVGAVVLPGQAVRLHPAARPAGGIPSLARTAGHPR